MKKNWLAPAFALLLVFSMAFSGYASSVQASTSSTQWSQVGGSIGLTGEAASVESLVSLNGVLYAATKLGVWAWDGSAWSQVGASSFPANDLGEAVEVHSLVSVNWTLYAGTDGSGLWAWDGSAWSQVGGSTGLTGNAADVHSLVSVNWTLYAGTDNGVWAWNGSAWAQVGSPTDFTLAGQVATVNSLVSVGGTLYAGMNLLIAGSTDYGGVWAWDGTSWSWAGNGLDNAEITYTVLSLDDVGGTLYAGDASGMWAYDSTLTPKPLF